MWLLLYAPVAGTLISKGRPEVALLGALIIFFVEQIPDLDQLVPFLKHRGFSHTLGFALLVGVVVGILGLFIGERLFIVFGDWLISQGLSGVGNAVIKAKATVNEHELAIIGFGMGTFGIVAHLAGDVLTDMGIRPFWPVSSRTISLSRLKARNPLANELLFALGIGALASAVWVGFGLGLDVFIPPDGTVESVLQEMLR